MVSVAAALSSAALSPLSSSTQTAVWPLTRRSAIVFLSGDPSSEVMLESSSGPFQTGVGFREATG